MKTYILFIPVILLAVLTSCTKSYTCSCTTTVTFAGGDPHLSKSSGPIGVKTTQAQAAAICKATEAELSEQLKQQLADPHVSSTSSAACALE